MNTDSSQTAARLPRRWQWGLLLFFAAVVFLFGVGDVIQGQDADPAIVESLAGMEWEALQAASPREAYAIDMFVRANGLQLMVIGLFGIGVTWYGFRSGQRWAWYVMWLLPLWALAVFVFFILADRDPAFGPPPPMLSGPVLFALGALPLLLSYRRFFPKPAAGQ